MPSDTAPQAAEALAVLRVSGADTQNYLQGQLSADLRHARAGELAWAGLHSPQGRTLALLALAPLPARAGEAPGAPGAAIEWVALLPASLAAAAAAALRRFVLRARVRIEPLAQDVLRAPSGPPPAHVRVLRQPDGRTLWFDDGGAGAAPDWAAWARADVALGLPQVYPETAGTFVAQMLNLDCIGAIGFDKGCYTGQEVIARAHYRGRVKRRMQRFAARAWPAGAGGAPLAPGASLRLPDGRGAQLVRAARQADGSVEFLAVCAWPAGAAAEAAAPQAPAAPSAAPSAAVPAPEAAAAPVAIDARPLPLPYELPA